MEKVTGKTLLERVLLKSTKHVACITAEVERLIDEHDLPQLYNGWTEENEEELAESVIRSSCSENDEERYEELKRLLERSLRQIREYKELCQKVEERRVEKYDCENSHHEKK
ncbi:unnamed protein product [Enterobius vermicularis]|uniref:Protein ZNF783-like n=1 Tax=Enterobius vermicularis TaxID=51028 RepID=A0A0N4VE75_ENTVE|nr:unnamed protein product [Enterobius vermicularis]